MKNAYVLMTAMPPTVGHINLIRFAAQLGDSVKVILNTMPHEPYAFERVNSLREAVAGKVDIRDVVIYHIHQVLPQAPEECDNPQDFWDMWRVLLHDRGFQDGDYIVASEDYGIELAKQVNGHFMPYDPDRDIRFSKATLVRDDADTNWDMIIPEFQRRIRPIVTFFGAESCGKTTCSRGVAASYDGLWLPEYARPYLEMVGPEISTQSMKDIWHGQTAFQKHARMIATQRLIVQDTDLFSTVGYWNFWQPESMPQGLEYDALTNQSDLYIVMNSNIPFEEDPIRYGGGVRESTDQYWIDLCERYDLNYHVMQSTTPVGQMEEAQEAIESLLAERYTSLSFTRTFN